MSREGEVIDWWRRGYHDLEIAKKLNMNSSTTGKIRRNLGLPPNPKGPTIDNDKFFRLYIEGKSKVNIAKILGVNLYYVDKKILAFKLESRNLSKNILDKVCRNCGKSFRTNKKICWYCEDCLSKTQMRVIRFRAVSSIRRHLYSLLECKPEEAVRLFKEMKKENPKDCEMAIGEDLEEKLIKHAKSI